MLRLANAFLAAPNDFEFTGRRRRSGAMRGYAARRCPPSGPRFGPRTTRDPVARSISNRDLARAARDRTPHAGRSLWKWSQVAAVKRLAARRDTPRLFNQDRGTILRPRAQLGCAATTPPLSPLYPTLSYFSRARGPTFRLLLHQLRVQRDILTRRDPSRITISSSPARAAGPVR